MIDHIVSFAVDRIGDFLLTEAQSLYGCRAKVADMQEELRWMRSFLKDMEAREESDERVRAWVADIRNLAYDAEDIIETFIPEEISTSSISYVKRFFGSGNINHPTPLSKFNSEVEAITSRISKLSKRIEDYGVKKLGEGSRSSWPDRKQPQLRRTYSHVPELNVVGLEADTEKLVELLVNETHYCRVVSICGMGGLGKTTLAKKIYHHRRVRCHFKFFVWIYVSQEWKARDIWEKILFKLISPDQKKRKEIANMNDDEIAKMLYQEQQVRKCLVVLDDIWSIHAWKSLSPGFPVEGTGSKILLTSRVKEVALCIDTSGFIHEPQSLNADQSWELFEKIISGRDGTGFRIETSMEQLGREMVEYCKGLPLAIIVLGGLLATKSSFSEWDMVHKNMKSYLKRGTETGEEQLGVFDVLALSYDYLPGHLKPCFLYLGLFPEDFDISVERLINLWVAEGIVLPSVSGEEEEEEILEDIAYRYLGELVERYMVLVEKRDWIGRIETCHMHDLMRELCLLKAKREQMFQIMHLNDNNSRVNCFSSFMAKQRASTVRIRRLAVHLNNFSGRVPLNGNEYPPYRSMVGFSSDGYSGMDQQLIESIIDKFTLLRILDLEQVKGFAIPEKIGKLVHLRLLNLRSAWIGKLPSSIGDLKYLLTLNLDPYYSAAEIPDVLWKLERLRHLYLPRTCGQTKKLTLGNLTHLQTLINFPASIADVKDLPTLISLRKLVIITHGETLFRELMEVFRVPNIFDHLQSLSILSSQLFWEEDVQQIVSCCPRLNLVKLNGDIMYPRDQCFPSSSSS